MLVVLDVLLVGQVHDERRERVLNLEQRHAHDLGVGAS